MVKKFSRFNPNRIKQLSDPKKIDIFSPPLPVIPQQYLSNKIFTSAVVEEWNHPSPSIVTALTTEEWLNNVPPGMAKITTEEWPNTVIIGSSVVEEWTNNPPTMSADTTEEWQNEPPSFQLLTTEQMVGTFDNAPFYNTTVADSVQNLKGAGGTTLDAVGEVIKAGALDTKVEIQSVKFKLKKIGSPTGNAFLRLRNASNVSLKTGSSLDVSTIAGVATEYTFTVGGTPWLLQTGYSLTIEYTGGTSTDYVEVSTQNPISAGQYNMLTHSPTNGWLETTTIAVFGDWA